MDKFSYAFAFHQVKLMENIGGKSLQTHIESTHSDYNPAFHNSMLHQMINLVLIRKL